MGLPYGENFIFLTSTVFVWSTRVTDGRTDGGTNGRTGDSIYMRYSIYAVARKNVCLFSALSPKPLMRCIHFLQRMSDASSVVASVARPWR